MVEYRAKLLPMVIISFQTVNVMCPIHQLHFTTNITITHLNKYSMKKSHTYIGVE